MIKNKLAIAALFFFSAGCRDSAYADMSNEEIHDIARSMPLEQRYQFYLEILGSSIPNNPAVAEDLALLGAPARQYVITKALSGDRYDFTRAIGALAAFDQKCSALEARNLRKKSISVANNKSDREILWKRVNIACELQN